MTSKAGDHGRSVLGGGVEAMTQDGVDLKGRTNLQPLVSLDGRRKVSKMMQDLDNTGDHPLVVDRGLVDQVIFSFLWR
jgi:hypothetical protein